MKARTVNDLILSFKKRLTSIGSPLANFSPYSNVYALFRSIASVLSEQDTRLNNAINDSFVMTATGSNLDRRAEDFGLYRLIGTTSSGSILVKGIEKTRMQKGTILSTSSRALQFELLDTIELKPNREVLGKVRALSNGSQYNLPQGTKLYSISYSNVEITVGYSRNPINGTPIGSISGGSLAESDNEFRSRILDSIRKKDRYVGTSSNLKEQILTLPYVTKVFINNHSPVTGYFTVYVDNRDQRDLNYIRLFINSIKPVGTLFLLKPLIMKPVSISIECEGGSRDTKSTLTSAVMDYLSALSIGEPLKLSDLSHYLTSIHPRATITSPVTDIYPGKESIISASSIKVLI